MPRKRIRLKHRTFDPTAEELWVLLGRPLPPVVPGCIRSELGFRRAGDQNEYSLEGLNALVVVMGVGESRIRALYEAAPEDVRRQIPELDRKVREGKADEALLREYKAVMEKRQREYPWKDGFLKTWLAMTEAEQDLVASIACLRPGPLTEKGEVKLRQLEGELAALRAAA